VDGSRSRAGDRRRTLCAFPGRHEAGSGPCAHGPAANFAVGGPRRSLRRRRPGLAGASVRPALRAKRAGLRAAFFGVLLLFRNSRLLLPERCHWSSSPRGVDPVSNRPSNSAGRTVAGAFAAALLIAQAALAAPPAAARPAPDSFADLAAKLLPSVVNISTTQT